MEASQGFAITHHKGFHMTFKNGWTISVQWGPGNYCDRYDTDDFMAPVSATSWESRDAEIAAWGPDGAMCEWPNGDTVVGRLTPDEVLAIMNDVASR